MASFWRAARAFWLAAALLAVPVVFAQSAPPAAPAGAAEAPAAATQAAPAPAQPAVSTAPAPAAPAAAPSSPVVVAAATLSAGDTAWMLCATALVLLMTLPGLALFYAGMVRTKNVLATMAQCFATVCVVTLIWVACGYSLAFTPGTPWVGGFERVMLDGLSYAKEAGQVSVSHLAPNIPESVFAMYQLTFAAITPALITGAFAERMRFSALLWFMGLWSLVVYAPVAHWVWEPGGWLAARGVLDFAGGTVVHVNAGVAGLLAALALGPRAGHGREPMPPHNLALSATGAALLWVGWFGFNAGSALAADGRAGMAMLVTQVATAMAAVAWMLAEWMTRGRPTLLGMASGAVAGLVAITPASGFVDARGALIIGAVAGPLCYFGATAIKAWFGYDDSLDVFGVHALAGIAGAVLTGLLADKSIGGAAGNAWLQLAAVAATAGYSAIATVVVLTIVNTIVGLRVDAPAEEAGLDLSQHGEQVG